jgi:hypothetical protein
MITDTVIVICDGCGVKVTINDDVIGDWTDMPVLPGERTEREAIAECLKVWAFTSKLVGSEVVDKEFCPKCSKKLGSVNSRNTQQK